MAHDQVISASARFWSLVGSAQSTLTRAFTAYVPIQQGQSSGPIRVVLSEQEIIVVLGYRDETSEFARFAIASVERGGCSLSDNEIRRLGSGDTVVALPASEALRRVVQLPIGAAKNLRKILRYELDRHSPIDPNQVYFDYAVKEQDKAANRLAIDVRIIKRGSIERAVTLCRSLGLEPVSVEVEGDIVPMNWRDLPLNRAAVARALWRRWSVLALSVVILLLTVGVMTAAAARNELAASVLEMRLQEARAKAEIVQQLRTEIGNAEKRAAFLTAEKRNPIAVQVLAELTRALPDGTWIHSFQLAGRELRIRGFSSSASPLIGLLDMSGFFANAQFRAPLTQGPQNGMERFDLSLDVKGRSL